MSLPMATQLPNGWDLTPPISCNCAHAPHFGVSRIYIHTHVHIEIFHSLQCLDRSPITQFFTCEFLKTGPQ